MTDILDFRNDGEAELLALTTMGAHIPDESRQQFKFFGSGAKHAFAVLLRTGHEVIVYSGLTRHVFTSKPVTIRGKDFELIYLDDQPLGFTTAFGPKWKLWQAYRELHCNCTDEGGTGGQRRSRMPSPRAGETHVIVKGTPFAEIHEKRDDFILNKGKALFALECVEVYSGSSDVCFYRGISVGKSEHSSLFTYNILEEMELTEERTLKQQWDANYEIARAIVSLTDTDMIKAILEAPEGHLETTISLPSYNTPSQEFMDVTKDYVQNKAIHVPKNIWTFYRKHAKVEDTKPNELVLSDLRQRCLDQAVEFCEEILDMKISNYPIKTTDGLGDGGLGAVMDGVIWLNVDAFPPNGSKKELVKTLVEEYIHIRYGVNDFTRGFQEKCLTIIVGLAEQLKGEAF